MTTNRPAGSACSTRTVRVRLPCTTTTSVRRRSRSGKSVTGNTRTAPRTPCGRVTSPTTIRSPAPREPATPCPGRPLPARRDQAGRRGRRRGDRRAFPDFHDDPVLHHDLGARDLVEQVVADRDLRNALDRPLGELLVE